MNISAREGKREFVRQVIYDFGRWFVITAMVDGSAGACTPREAEKCIDKFLQGEDNEYSDRCIALYEYDLVEMMFDDVSSFMKVSEEERNRRIEANEGALTVVLHDGAVLFLGPSTPL
jgi:hypothetical protein